MNHLITKTFLYAYSDLESLAEAAEVAAENKAVLSFRALCSAYDAAETVAEELRTAARLIRLKEELDAALGCLSEEEHFLLEYKYFRRGEAGADARSMYPSRSYFRRQAALQKRIACLLAARGWTNARFLEEFGKYAPFVRLFRALKMRERAMKAGVRERGPALRVPRTDRGAETGACP